MPTFKKIQRLAEYREQHLKSQGSLPTWTSSCQKIGIEHRTVKRHAPQLYERWDDENFYW